MADQVTDEMEFRNRNREGWELNSDYWLNSRLRHIEDTRAFIKSKLRLLLDGRRTVVDMGCGDGYFIEYLFAAGKPFDYVGLDFNPRFIDHLKIKYSGSPNCSFDRVDLEEPITKRFWNSADLVINSFNFFEFANLSMAFENACRMLKDGGQLVILTIDPSYLMLALSHTMDELKEIMRVYESTKARGNAPRFFQSIDLGDGVSKTLTYASVLYSLKDYYGLAKRRGLQLVDYDEIICTSKFIPKIYQYVVFEKVKP